MFEDDRAVSDVIGFVFVFALIVATVGVVFVAGTGGLEAARDAEQLNNAERAFDVLAANIDSVVRDNAPSRATEFKLAGSSIGYDDRTTITVNVTAEGENGDVHSESTAQFRPITLRAADTELTYETGAVIRSDRNGAVMLDEPPLVFREDRAAITFAETQSSEPNRIGGSRTVLVRVEESTRRVLDRRTNVSAMTITIETTPDRAPVWANYLNEELPGAADPCAVDGGTVTCEAENLDENGEYTIVVSTTRMRLELA